ncbi:hypothetical protein VTN02DRAFT_100 [Thermoascus thermophilus]
MGARGASGPTFERSEPCEDTDCRHEDPAAAPAWDRGRRVDVLVLMADGARWGSPSRSTNQAVSAFPQSAATSPTPNSLHHQLGASCQVLYRHAACCHSL